MYNQAPTTAFVHPNWLLLHDGNQDVYWRRRYSARRDVLLIGGWARLISDRQSRLQNRQRNRVLFSNLRKLIRTLGAHICVL